MMIDDNADVVDVVVVVYLLHAYDTKKMNCFYSAAAVDVAVVDVNNVDDDDDVVVVVVGDGADDNVDENDDIASKQQKKQTFRQTRTILIYIKTRDNCTTCRLTRTCTHEERERDGDVHT